MATDNINAGTGNLAWDNAGNWTLGNLPTSSDDVGITGSSSGFLTVTIAATDPAYTVQSLTETTTNTSAGAETLRVSGSLTVTGATSLSRGLLSLGTGGTVSLNSVTLSNSAQISVSNATSTLSIANVSAGSGNPGSLLVSGGTASVTAITGSVANSVNVSVSSAAITVGSSSGAAFFNLNAGRLNLQSAATTLADTLYVNTQVNTVDLQAIAFQAGETYSWTQTNSGSSFYNTYTLTLKSSLSQTLYTFQTVEITSGQALPAVSLASDGSNGTVLTLACYVTGTRIAVPGGERAVEELAVGDHVVTASGRSRCIRWVGRRAYGGPFLRYNHRALPIRFRAGSLGENLPRRDLLVSPEHAMFLDGVLVPAHCLVNGASVVQEAHCDEVEYFHVELDSHDVLLAEGAPSESYVDDNSRAIFHNAREFAVLYPDAGSPPAVYCARRVEDGAELAAIRRAVDGRAGLLPDTAPTPLRGYVDALENGVLTGWAQDPAHPEHPLGLLVLLDGAVVAQTIAGVFRPDLRAAGLGSGLHGFRVRLPGRAAHGTVEVRRLSDGAVLGVLAARQPAAA